jgi:SAM-dependent methyltransferase
MKRILNCGCGTETYGTDFVDLYPSRREVIKTNIDEEKLPFNNNTFDEVYSNNLLEHLQNVGKVIGEMVRVLKKDGKLVIVTDNASYYLFHLWKPYSAHYFNYNQHGPADKHYALFTSTHLENFMKLLNMKIIEMDFITYYNPNKENPILKYPQRNSRLAIPNRIVGKLPVVSHMAFPRILLVAKK